MSHSLSSEKKDGIKAAICCCAFLLLILDSETTTNAAKSGITLCLQTVIPALFPLMLLAKVLMNTSFPHKLGKILGRPMKQIYFLSPRAASCLVLGALGGYPIGTQTVAHLYQNGAITKKQADHLLGFCNFASPAFAFGVLGAIFDSLSVSLVLYGIHLLSALLVGILLRPPQWHPADRMPSEQSRPKSKESPINSTIHAMAAICAYIILMQIFIAFIDKCTVAVFPHVVSIAISGVLELSAGCLRLHQIESMGWRYCMASGFMAFGGLCVFLQAKEALVGTGLSAGAYLYGKLLHGVTAMLLTWLAITLLPDLLPLDIVTLQLPNHQGVIRSTLTVMAAVFCAGCAWYVVLRKKAGKPEPDGV